MEPLSLEKEVAETAESAGSAAKRGRKRGNPQAGPGRKRSKAWIALVVIVVLAAGLIVWRNIGRRTGGEASRYTYAATERRDITETLTGSGTLQPADSYTVTTLVSGEILSADFEEGGIVSKGDVLYKIDSSNAATSIERAEISLSRSRRAYDEKVASQADLTVTAPIGGTVTGITVQVGNSVGTQAAIATIENTTALTLTEYYSDAYAGQIYAGMAATVSVPDQMLNLPGQVKEVTALKRISDTGVSCFAVMIQVVNPGALTVGTAASCALTSGDGTGIYPTITDERGFAASERKIVYAGVSGAVADVKVRNNETVAAGQAILLLSSSTLSDEILSAADTLRDAELSLQGQYDALDNYTITAPIDGTIVDKYYKEGETSRNGEPLCIIYDLSNLTLTLNVDELDISKVSVGQAAAITVDAVAGRAYEGVVTRVGVNGTTGSGVTTYPVTIRIDDTEGLLPGMNADVSIVVSESKNALTIPAAAVARSNRILVRTADGATGEGAPEGFKYVEVRLGISDDDYAEVLSGLNDGDTVAYIPETAADTAANLFMFEEQGQRRFESAGPGGPANDASGGVAAPGGGM